MHNLAQFVISVIVEEKIVHWLNDQSGTLSLECCLIRPLLHKSKMKARFRPLFDLVA
jgi:hypothetical protein